MRLRVARARRTRPTRARTASRRVPPCDRRPQGREMRVERESAPEPGLRIRLVAETAFHHAAVKELRGVERPEPQRTLRVVQRVRALTAAGKGPSENVVTVDRGPFMVCGPCKRECLG